MSLAVAAQIRTVEILRFQPSSARAHLMFEALLQTTPAEIRAIKTTTYRGHSDLLCLWGPGAPNRFDPMRQQVMRGGHVLAFDLAYWDRERKVRVSIDAAHPQDWVMWHDWPASRFESDNVRIFDAWDPAGPVIIAGIGDKATVQYGAQVKTWEALAINDARAAGRLVRYRPKKMGALPGGVGHAGVGPIEQVLDGASCLMTWHSNVAVDAIRLGIPVICRDGAARAVCHADRLADARPLEPAVRDRFLQNLAWFQWRPEEASALWTWVQELLA